MLGFVLNSFCALSTRSHCQKRKMESATPSSSLLNDTAILVNDRGLVNLPPKYFKIILTSGLFLLTIGVSLIPLRCLALAQRGPLRRRRKFQKMISVLSCFAGGVFLGACFLDLFPEVKETMDGAISDLGLETDFPIPEFVMIYGLFVVLVTEQVVVQYQESGLGPALGGHGHSHGGPPARVESPSPIPEDESDDEVEVQDAARAPAGVETEKSALIGGRNGRAQVSPRGYGSANGHANDRLSHNQESGSLDYSHAHARHHRNDDASMREPHHHHRHHHNEQMSDRHSTLRAVLLLFALSLHSLFEGLALGLLTSNDVIISIFSALIIHKLVMGFSLGLNLVQSKLSVCSIVGSIFFFSITSPVGAAIGIVVSETYQTPLAQLISGILQAIAGGTFLYVTFFEVLPHEMNAGGNRLLKVLAIILGFTFIATMMILLPHA